MFGNEGGMKTFEFIYFVPYPKILYSASSIQRCSLPMSGMILVLSVTVTLQGHTSRPSQLSKLHTQSHLRLTYSERLKNLAYIYQRFIALSLLKPRFTIVITFSVANPKIRTTKFSLTFSAHYLPTLHHISNVQQLGRQIRKLSCHQIKVTFE